MSARLLAAACALCLSACVSQKQYDSIRTELDATQSELEERNAALAAEQKRAGRAQAEFDALKLALRNEQEKVKESELRMLALHKEMAAALKDKARLKANVEELASALMEAQRRKEEGESRVREFKVVLDRLRALMTAGKLKVRVVDGRVVVVLPSDVLFAPGSASLSPEGTAAVSSVATALAGLPGRRFQVEGHTDATPIRTKQFPSNWELASARALHVLRAMLAAGMPPARVSAASYGATRPVSPNTSAEGRALNRRIDIMLVPDLSHLPGMEELKRTAPGGAQETLANEAEEEGPDTGGEPPRKSRAPPAAGGQAGPGEDAPEAPAAQEE
jgi:chemotaxis protein MotB